MTSQHIIIKSLKANGKEKILKAGREKKRRIMYTLNKKIRLIVDCSLKTSKKSVFQYTKKKNKGYSEFQTKYLSERKAALAGIAQ